MVLIFYDIGFLCVGLNINLDASKVTVINYFQDYSILNYILTGHFNYFSTFRVPKLIEIPNKTIYKA